MSILGTSGIGEEESGGSESLYVAQLGRIGGKLLSANLVRNGVDLAFRNTLSDPEILYLKVGDPKEGYASTNDPLLDPQYSILTEPPYDDGDPNWGSGSSGRAVGINVNNPVYTLDVSSLIISNDAEATSTAYVDNITFQSPRTITTASGPIEITHGYDNGIALFDRLGTIDISNNPVLVFDGNSIQSRSNQNIVFDPNASGTIELTRSTNIVANNPLLPALSVSGNTVIGGNLQTTSNIIVGDSPLDVVTIQTDFSQDINPGLSNLKLGSTLKRWSEAHIDDWTNITNLIPTNVYVNNKMRLGGTATNRIYAISGNEDLILNPDTGINNIEKLVIQDNTFTSLMQQPDLDPNLTAAGILAAAAGDPNASLFNTVVTAPEFFLGGGQVVRTERTGLLGDVRNDLDNPGVLDIQDANKVLEIYNRTNGTTNEQIWYRTKLRPAIVTNPTEYAKWGQSGTTISDTPFTVSSTGIGYTVFSDNTALVIPVGTSAERQYLEVGDTRWNTDLNLLECFDGERYIVSTGPGAVVTNDLMIELAITRALFLG